MMKKKYLILLLLLCLFVMTHSLADSSFDMQCWLKTGSGTTLYQLANPDGGITVGGEGSLEKDFKADGTLPAGTYVKVINTLSGYGLDQISYSGGSGYVLSSSLVEAVGTVSLDDGTTVEIPEAMVGHTSAIISYLSSSYNATFTAIEGSSVIHVEYNNGKVEWKEITTERLSFVYQDQDITMESLGSAYSTILLNGDKLTVPTSSISWDSEMAADHQLAFINAPKTGRASMHLKASNKSLIIQKCPQGKVMAVISGGKNFTKVWCDGYVGYVQTKALTFCNHKVPDVSVQLAYITFRGKVKSKNEMHVRAAAKNTSRVLGTYRAGTPAILFNTTEDGEWCEIEVDGIHCYILSEFITKASELGI